ncbi:protein of unknown function DUF156 [Desulfofarcimen acetoxidans DSM 771]|jgi:DNA-binding FrmR family transcriptional regulator|uniref:Transcriptional regulator n=1 Tax=Desulfofarcimen acetoxidans (strain ATCC 49208 / DSM 771 / KCTC 5769 / VKM B-1644 / 5575) TaxID=485916 RepID=C8VYZ6_DESAS|nr:metal-sensitive transcriptional regulator [Desulfofarcimen acetoxidans]ACV62906.1 protein of unknown function DUF156 [Desulfofarcimen acetoxidans DSM 771]
MENSKKDMLNRLKRIEGQVRGIHKMIEEDRYCVDIMLQISATRAALQKVALSLLGNHTRGCVADAFKKERGEEAIKELVQVLDKFMN